MVAAHRQQNAFLVGKILHDEHQSWSSGLLMMLGKWSNNNKHDFVIGYHYIHRKPKRFEFVVWEAGVKLHKRGLFHLQ